MRCGAIDIGTNSCRMLIADYKDDYLREVKRNMKITRLGEGVDKTGKLNSSAVQRVVNAVKKFSIIMKKFKAERVEVVGTSALRDVNNASFLISRIKEETGYGLKIISGQEEARLNFLGAGSDLKTEKDFLLLDIGGGSTEFVWKSRNGRGKEAKIIYKSLDIGSVRLTERYIDDKDKDVHKKELDEIGKNIVKVMKSNLCITKDEISLTIGVGGTITTLAAINCGLKKYRPEKIHQYVLKFKTVEKIVSQLALMTLDEKKKLDGLQPERADIIVAGGKILEVIMKELNIKEITVSEHDLLHGIIKNN